MLGNVLSCRGRVGCCTVAVLLSPVTCGFMGVHGVELGFVECRDVKLRGGSCSIVLLCVECVEVCYVSCRQVLLCPRWVMLSFVKFRGVVSNAIKEHRGFVVYDIV